MGVPTANIICLFPCGRTIRSDPFWHSYRPDLKDRVGPRNLVHSYATATDDPTVQPRWGKVGKQRIVDEGPLPPHGLAVIVRRDAHVADEHERETLEFQVCAPCLELAV
jgi:hypothetical protein